MAARKAWRLAVAIASVALLAASGMAVWRVSTKPRPIVDALHGQLRSDIHNVGLAIYQYRKDHDGNPPGVLRDIVREGYLDSPEILEAKGKEIVYRPLKTGAPYYSVLAYYWPPWFSDGSIKELGFVALFNDLTVAWVECEEPDGLSTAERTRTHTEAWWLKEILANVGREISSFQRSHGGAYPPTIKTRYEEERKARSGSGTPVMELIYSPPAGEAKDAVIAYFWPPVFGGTVVLFQNLTVEWLATESDGSVLNPWTGKPIREQDSPGRVSES